ncbi:hypothetical protein DFA_01947 [Cavenderia fasciculata]|uniref:ComC supersandwich domain-containing protein n=1 Tax=Cavenderia fasciculata TaxID=261658 RepID=F4PQU9_CACFS|nr:uncharacterized protein DFA_01947 [Cavenderia fasciculata]EGG22057.1 hypothetical protein DFA_01947 [Cavenderia fasciculata]|eukprot:XP_004359908.1 hypothetical protein DFA_01947 [Cavenderia fasciculata]
MINNIHIIISSIILIFIRVCTSQQSILSKPELDSAIFVIQQFGIPSIPQDQSLCNYGSSPIFKCSNSGTGGSYHIDSITISGITFTNVGNPNTSIQLDFPQINSIYLSHTSVRNNSINFLDYVKNLSSLVTFYTSAISLVNVPDDFLSMLPNMRNLVLHRISNNIPKGLFNHTGLTQLSLGAVYLTTAGVNESTVNLPSLASLSLNFSPRAPETISITPETMPNLKYLSINSGTSSKTTVKLNSTTVFGLFLTGGRDKHFDVQIVHPEVLGDIYLSGALTSWTPKDMKYYPNLVSLNFQGVDFSEYPITKSYPPNLATFSIVYSNLTTIPNIPLPLTISIFQAFTNNFTSFPWDIFNNVKTSNPIVLSENVNLIGTVPESMCRFKLKIQNTSITSVPSCFWCYQALDQVFLTSLERPPNFICPVTFDNQVIATRAGQALVYGSNLGWGFKTSEYTLTPITPNSVLQIQIQNFGSYYLSQPKALSLNLSNNAQTSYNINVIEAGIVVSPSNNNFTYTQQPSHLQLRFLFSSLNPNLKHQVQLNYSLSCTTILLASYSITCNSIIPEPEYPTVTSGIVNNNNNDRSKLISLYGYYGNLNQTNPSVLINNTLICNIGFINDRLINCTIETINQNYGPASVKVQIDNLQYFKNDVLYFYPPNNNNNNNNTDQLLKQCQETTLNCFGNGQCNEFGKCDCIENYNPIDNCLTKYFNSSVNTTTDPLKPTTSFDINGVDFQFEIVSIQELNENDQVAKQLIVDKWSSTITTINSTTIANYYLIVNQSEVTMPLLNVSAVISYSPLARTTMFGGNEIEMNPNSIKLSIEINNWEFSSNINSLRVLFKTNLPNDQSIEICQQASDEIKTISYDLSSSSIQYLRVLKDGIQFTGRFLDYIVSDGRNTYSRTQLVSLTPSEQSPTTESVALIGILLPQCQSCIIDPDFTPLLVDTSQSQCGDNPSNNNTWKIIVGVTIGGVVLIVTIVGAILYAKKYTNLKYSNSVKIQNK